MTKDEEKALIGTISNLMDLVANLEQGQKLMTDAFVLLESRINVLEGKKNPSLKLILPKHVEH